jgi:hypothetical protein
MNKEEIEKSGTEAAERKVLAAVESGANRLSVIVSRVQATNDREVDRVLQRLRRQGKLMFDSKKGWTTK